MIASRQYAPQNTGLVKLCEKLEVTVPYSESFSEHVMCPPAQAVSQVSLLNKST